MFQTFNMPLHYNRLDAFCFDCVYRHQYIITQCSHTICLTCLYEAIEEKILRQSKIFICPRCTDSEERRIRLGHFLIRKSNEGEQEIGKFIQSPKVGRETSSDQQSKLNFMLNEERDSDLFWPLGTETWHIHEIKPQRELRVHKASSEKLMISQPTANNHKPHCWEDPPEFANVQGSYISSRSINAYASHHIKNYK